MLAIRCSRGLRRKQLSHDAGISVAALGQYEQGVYYPRMNEFARWCRAVKLRPDELHSAIYLLAETADTAGEPAPLLKLMEAS